MKLTPLQKDSLRRAYNEAVTILRQIKLKPLKGKALEDMKTLETAVQHLEVLLIA